MFKSAKKILVLVPALFVLGCNTVAYNPHKTIEPKGNMFTRTLTQDGKTLNPFEALKGLQLNPATAEDAKKAETWTYVSYGLGFAGGFLVGYNLTKGADGSGGLLGGLALIGGAAGAAYMADGPLQEAIRIHNSGSRKKRSALNFDMQMMIVQQNAVPGFGLHYQF